MNPFGAQVNLISSKSWHWRGIHRQVYNGTKVVVIYYTSNINYL